jgi:hypothetical protein
VLTEREQAILDFERSWWTADGVKDSMILRRLRDRRRRDRLSHTATGSDT